MWPFKKKGRNKKDGEGKQALLDGQEEGVYDDPDAAAGELSASSGDAGAAAAAPVYEGDEDAARTDSGGSDGSDKSEYHEAELAKDSPKGRRPAPKIKSEPGSNASTDLEEPKLARDQQYAEPRLAAAKIAGRLKKDEGDREL